MPIRPEFRKFYGREWRTVTRPRILERAGGRCEQCGKPDRQWVVTSRGGCWSAIRDGQWPRDWRTATGGSISSVEGAIHATCVILTVAHLNHVPGDDRDENLKALCQWCHLNYDQLHHKEIRQTRKDARRPLLVAAGGLECTSL